MFMFSRKDSQSPAGARGYRAYVVGDVHGRLDLLDALLDKIHADMEQRAPRETILVFVGDLIDRGPSSAGVIERLRNYQRPGVRPVFLLGNHEEVLLRILDGEASLIPNWLRFGGAQCLASYGGDPRLLAGLSDDQAVAAVREAVRPEHAQFIREFVDTFRFGDYLVVHAGIRPGIALDEQHQADLRWIREPFLLDDSDHGFVVVHGHTIHRKVQEKGNRIGIDTGAFAHGVLTALAIDGPDRWFLEARVGSDIAAIAVTH